MANRTLRRGKGTDKGERTITVTGNGTPESVTDGDGLYPASVSDSDGTERAASDTATDDASESDSVDRNGVIEVDPAALGDFIASGGASSQRVDSGGDADSTGGRRARSNTGERRKRGPNKRSGKETPQDISPLLNIVHTWAPIVLGIPELAASEDEIKTLSDAYTEFCKHHSVPEVTQKRMTEVNLVIALGMVYGTRFVAFAKRKREENKAGPKLVPMPQQSTHSNVM